MPIGRSMSLVPWGFALFLPLAALAGHATWNAGSQEYVLTAGGGTLDDDSPYVDGALHAGDGLTSLQFRRRKGAITEQIEAAVKGADVVQLERRGDTYTHNNWFPHSRRTAGCWRS